MSKKQKSLDAITEKDSNGVLTAIASTEDQDRAGDVLSVKQWSFKKFKMNPVLQAGHNYAPQFTIGIAKNIRIEGKKVLFEPVFHSITPLAKQIKEMYEKGFLKAWSVGFIPAEDEKDFHELLEVSAVAVPANAFALMKGFEGDDTEVEMKEWVEEELKEVDVTETPEDVEVKAPEDTIETPTEIIVKEEVLVEEKDYTPWNKTLPSIFSQKEFDITSVKPEAMTFENKIFTKFFDCKVKDLYLNFHSIPSPLLGSYLSAFKKILADYELVDTRNWHGNAEFPPQYKTIQLNSKENDSFLVEGTVFYKVAGRNALALSFYPTWMGIVVEIVTPKEKREWAGELLQKVHTWVDQNNYLRGEKFALSGEFIPTGNKEWDDIIADEKNIKAVKRGMKVLEPTSNKSRGLLFVGPPGTGKTMTGKILMDNTDATFIWISSKDMDRVGAVTALKMGFQLARDLGPSVLFMEDIDYWIKGYAIDTLKTELDGMHENNKVLTILTSNFPQDLPDALLDRPGRFHEILNYDLPTKEIRSEMIQKWAEVDDKTADSIAELTEGLSGAHIKELVEYAKDIAGDEGIEMSEALLKSLEKMTEQKELINTIRQSNKSFAIIEKEGKVISKKNMKTLVIARDALQDVIGIDKSESEEDTTEKFMEDLSIAVKEIEDNETTKKLNDGDMLTKTLQSISKSSNKTLCDRKKAGIK